MAARQKLSFVGKKPLISKGFSLDILHTLPFFGINIPPSFDILNERRCFLHATKCYGADEANITYLSC